jgi:hypothetical protein
MRNPYEYARKAKEAHPERYCAAPNCLWQLVHGQTGMPLAPCAKHPKAGRGKAESLNGLSDQNGQKFAAIELAEGDD